MFKLPGSDICVGGGRVSVPVGGGKVGAGVSVMEIGMLVAVITCGVAVMYTIIGVWDAGLAVVPALEQAVINKQKTPMMENLCGFVILNTSGLKLLWGWNVAIWTFQNMQMIEQDLIFFSPIYSCILNLPQILIKGSS